MNSKPSCALVANEANIRVGGRVMRLTTRIARQSVATLLSGLLVFQPMLVQAQVTPDINAPAGNQPGIGATPNGVPLVDIVTPNGQGLSHNKYGDFNVGTPGLILNNHNSEIGISKLGGVTPGNPNLRNSGPASVILNEVTSGNRSSLQGATEVFGGRADVIIANPNGITCDGCGFINTPHATLTTGTPDIDGSGRLSGFTVQGGDVTFGSKGGNFASGEGAVDLFDIVSRRIQIDGPVNGKNLRLTAGRQKFDYATGEATALGGADDAGEFAIDGSALGAMQADRIKIVVTDKGAGVRMRSDMAAHTGELTLSADGKISLGNASARDGVNIQSKSKQVEAKKLASQKRVVVKADKGITLQSVAADEDVILGASTGLLSVAGDITALGNAELTASGAISVNKAAAGGNADIRGGQGVSAAEIIANGSANLNTTSGNVSVSGLAKAGKDDLTISAASGSISAGSLISFKNMGLTAGQDIGISGDLLSGNALIAQARSIKAGNVASGVDFAATNAANGAIVLGSSGDMNLQASAGVVDVTSLLSAGNLNVSGASVLAQNVTSHGRTALTGSTTITNQLLSGSDIIITGASINLGTAVAGVDLAELKSGNVILSNAAHTINLTATAGDLTANRLLSSGGMVASASENLSANVLSYGDLDLTAGRTLVLSGQSMAGGNAKLTAGTMTLETLVSGVDFAATEQSGGSLILKTGIPDTGVMILNASNGSIIADQLLSGGDLKARAQHDISYNNLQSFAAADLNAVMGAISLDHDTIAKGNIVLSLQSLDLSNDRSKLATAGTLIVNAGHANLANATLTFGGIALNLSGSADASNAKIRAVMADGGSGDITIAAQTVTTTPATAILAANDLTLTLASLTNAGQIAANNNLTFNISGNLTNTASGLLYAGRDGKLYVAGDLLNDQGAILVGNDLAIAANAQGGRNRSITNVSSLIKAERDASIITANLTNKRLFMPGWSDSIVSNDQTYKFDLNPETWGKPLGALYWNTGVGPSLGVYEGNPRPDANEWAYKLYGVVTLADGTSYRTRSLGDDGAKPWFFEADWSRVRSMVGRLNTLYGEYARDGKIVLTPELQNKFVIFVASRGDEWQWDNSTQMRQAIHEQKFDGALSPQALIQVGRDLNIDAITLNNTYSSIEAGGNAKLTGTVLNNEGIALYQTVTARCEAKGGCQAYDAQGNHDAAKDIAYNTSRITSKTIIGGAFGSIKAGGQMDISGFNSVNNTSAPDSIAGGAQLTTQPTVNDPTAVLNELTAGGALFTPNAALGGLSAEGQPLVGADLIAALKNTTPKPESGGFGGTIPGQTFLYETRAAFLDVGKFYGSGYFMKRIGYNPDRTVPFLGDAYFENQLVDQQLRQLVHQGLGKGSFIPGSDAIEQMKALLDRGADYAAAHGLIIGEKLSPEQIASLTETMVWYEEKIVNGISVLVPTVYLADADKANLTAAGAMISGDVVRVNAANVNNSGAYSAKTNLQISANNITAAGGSFKANNDVTLSASQNLTISQVNVKLGGENLVTSGSGVEAGGSAHLAANQAVTLSGATVKAGKDAHISGQSVTLDMAKASNRGAETVIGSSIQSGGNTSVKAKDDVLIIGSSVAAKGNLDVSSDNGSVNVLAGNIVNKDTKLEANSAVQSSLTAGGDASIKAEKDILVFGSKVNADGKTSLSAQDNVTISEAYDTSSGQTNIYKKKTFGSRTINSSTSMQTAVGSSISGGAGVDITSGNDTIISASKVQAGTDTNKADLNINSGGDLIIASGKNIIDRSSSESKSSFLSKSSGKSHNLNETTIGTALGASGNVILNAERHVGIAGSTITAGENIAIEGDSVSVIGAQEQHDSSYSSKKSGFGVGSGGGFYSIYGKHEKSSSEDIVANVGSKLSAGNDVSIKARETDVNIVGSKVEAKNDITLNAARDVNILPGAESYASEEKEKRSGFGIQLKSGNGSASIGIGYGSSKDETRQGAETNAVSSLNAGRDVIITAGRDANLQAAQVEAGSTVDILAERDVNLLAAQDKTNFETMHKELFAGITATVSSSVVSAVGNVYDAAKKVGDGSSSQSIAMGTIAAINGYYAYDALVNGKPITPGEFKQDGPLLSTSISAGFQYQKNSASGSTSTPVPTSIRAGDTVVIEASSGDINAVGAQIVAGYDEKGLPSGGRGDIALIAGNDINLISAQATTENSSKNVSGGVQVNLDLTGGNFNLSKGNADGTTVTNVSTHVVGTGGVYLQSGNDTNLKGATVTGETVIADIGGDLNIESQLDTATSKAKQVGAGGGIGSSGAAISGSYQAAKGDAAIVSEQSGIRAGEGGFDIKVDGNTKLTGGVISSDADPKDNRLETGTLEFEDLNTHSEWKAKTYGGGISGKGPLVSPPIKEGESETGKALSAISPGEIIITDPANQPQNIDDLRRDTTNTNTSLPGIPDLQAILGEQLKTQQLYDDAAAKAANMIGDWSTKLYTEAATDAEREFWKEGGTGPTILHAIAGGLLGGVTDFDGMVSGMLGGASSAYLAPKIRELVAGFVKDAGLTGSAAEFMINTVTGSILQGIGGATGGTGAAYAGNAYQYNYLKHEEIIQYNDEMRRCGDDPSCQYKVFSEYSEISADRNDEVAACKTEECRKAHYDDFMKAKEVANVILNPFNHNDDQYYRALFTLQSNDVNSAVNEIAMARIQARSDAREQCGSDDACTQRYADEYFQLWANIKENKEIIAAVAGIVSGARIGMSSGAVGASKGRSPWTQISSDSRAVIRDVEANTGLNVPKTQRAELANELRNVNHGSPVSATEYAALQREYRQNRVQLIKEWEKNTGQTWPSGAQLHHIIPQRYGGPNQWWNAHPAMPSQHQGGIHGAGSSTQGVFPTPVPKK